jgi:hypothetical protein
VRMLRVVLTYLMIKIQKVRRNLTLRQRSGALVRLALISAQVSAKAV